MVQHPENTIVQKQSKLPSSKFVNLENTIIQKQKYYCSNNTTFNNNPWKEEGKEDGKGAEDEGEGAMVGEGGRLAEMSVVVRESVRFF